MREWIDHGFIALNILIVMRAIRFNAEEAKVGFREWRAVRFSAVVLASLYLTSYLILLTGVIDRLTWSMTMVGVSPVVWEIVWVWPARRARQVRRRMEAEGIRQIGGQQRSGVAA